MGGEDTMFGGGKRGLNERSSTRRMKENVWGNRKEGRR